MKPLLLWMVLFMAENVGHAAPSPPFDDIVRRAETIFVARLIAVDKEGVTVECAELLRGKYDGAMTLPWDHRNPASLYPAENSFRIGVTFLLMSQGDEKNGPTKWVFGGNWEARYSYCGWTPFPIKRVDGQDYVLGVYAHNDGNILWDKAPGSARDIGLTLDRVKKIIDQSPYSPKPAATK